MTLPSEFIINTIKRPLPTVLFIDLFMRMVGVCFPLVLFGAELLQRVHAHENVKGA